MPLPNPTRYETTAEQIVESYLNGNQMSALEALEGAPAATVAYAIYEAFTKHGEMFAVRLANRLITRQVARNEVEQ